MTRVVTGAAQPEAPDAVFDVVTLTQMADRLMGEGKKPEAIAQYRKALQVNADYLPARMGLAEVLSYSGQREEAIAEFEKALKQDLEHALGRLAGSLSYGFHRYEDNLDRSVPDHHVYQVALNYTQPNIGNAFVRVERSDIIQRSKAIQEGIYVSTLLAGGEIRLRPLQASHWRKTWGDLARTTVKGDFVLSDYSDDNSRIATNAEVAVRVFDLPKLNVLPKLDVGYRFMFDDTKEISNFYFSPQKYITHAAVFRVNGDFRQSTYYGVHLTLPFKSSGEDLDRGAGSFTIFGYAAYNYRQYASLGLTYQRIKSEFYESNEVNASYTQRF